MHRPDRGSQFAMAPHPRPDRVRAVVQTLLEELVPPLLDQVLDLDRRLVRVTKWRS